MRFDTMACGEGWAENCHYLHVISEIGYVLDLCCSTVECVDGTLREVPTMWQ